MIKKQELVGTWFHSYEEDTPTEQVYRRAGYEFPPARGRRGFEFRTDKTSRVIGIAARDGSTLSAATWKLGRGKKPQLTVTGPNGEPQVLKITQLEPDRLVVAKEQ